MPVRTKRVQVILSEIEFEKFKEYTERMGISMSELLRDYVKKLIKPS
jgi:hypothetical protein